MAYLTCKDLAVGYHGVPVVHGITFDVDPGSLTCIVGENGAGKSTLVKTMLGLVPPVSGVMELGDGLTAGEIGYLPQRGESQQDFPASAWEVALSGRLPRMGNRPFYRQIDRTIARDALARVGAEGFAQRPFSRLSGGQQQRVLLARALCAAARLLVLDEPTTGLDPDASTALWALLDKLCADGMAVIAVTHDVGEAANHADHVLALGHDGASFMTTGAYLLLKNGGLA